jgi:Zn-dependent M28 family amino/carboxypeptidase
VKERNVSLPTCVRQGHRGRKATILAVLTVVALVPVAGQSGEPVDLQAIYLIKEEGLQRSKVMEIASWATGVKLRRTVRLALWTGEEQGLLGSRAYVEQHFANREKMELKPGHAKLSAYFNVDNGTGAIRGVYLQGNESIEPVFRAWIDPFRNLGVTTLAIRNVGGTDHQSFDAVGLPGFQFIQDPVEYDSRTHHSNMDVYDRLQAVDMMQNAVIVASFVYHAANRDLLLPRKPLPGPPRPAPSAQ